MNTLEAPRPHLGPSTGQRRRWPMVLLAVALVGLLAAGACGAWVQRQVNPPGPVGDEVKITVTPGMSTSDIGKLLEREGVVTNATVFRYYARLQGAGSIQAGDYTLRRRQDLGDVLDALEQGARAEGVRLTVPEGLTLEEIADRVGTLPDRSAEDFLAAARSGTVRSQYQPPGSTNLEGLLLPETYLVVPAEDEAAILARMVDSFDQQANALNISAAAARLGVTPYEAVVVASMVEREARVHEDRGPVARVIYNRVERGMRLQIDATVQYALGEQKQSLLNSDLEIDSPYNTYKVEGLPPGPIASPGRAALEAALAPPPGPWIYYVLADPSGKHAFTDSESEFFRLKAEAQAKGLL